MLDCFKAQERVNGLKEQEDKTLRIKDTSGLHLYRVRPSHSFTPRPPSPPKKNTHRCLLFENSAPLRPAGPLRLPSAQSPPLRLGETHQQLHRLR